LFVIAAGYTWSSHLLLLSAQDKAPNGVANSSGLVGKYLAGHRNVQTIVELPLKLYPGMNEQHSLVTKQFMRLKASSEYIRHDLRIWESSNGRAPRLADDNGALMLGDAILDDWRRRTKTGTARVRAYYDVVPDRASELTLDVARKNEFGDPLPKLSFRDAPESVSMRARTEESLRTLFREAPEAQCLIVGGGFGRSRLLEVAEEFRWRRVVAPLARFCADPRRAPDRLRTAGQRKEHGDRTDGHSVNRWLKRKALALGVSPTWIDSVKGRRPVRWVLRWINRLTMADGHRGAAVPPVL